MTEENGIKYLRHSKEENVYWDFVSSKTDLQIKRAQKLADNMGQLNKMVPWAL